MAIKCSSFLITKFYILSLLYATATQDNFSAIIDEGRET